MIIEAILMDKRRLEREHCELRLALQIAADHLDGLGYPVEAKEARVTLAKTCPQRLRKNTSQGRISDSDFE